ncbi:hypothetical protein FGO68_gene8839 [Halteria grandinella]|uniref:Uncharacterized protein n=1 Tax=Halteria grandinella TaxID=5974 RepID=A0A8J8SUE1_HALGN|nr:hypothetical protein FGO68_gene8839 [Halteria grandinella]
MTSCQTSQQQLLQTLGEKHVISLLIPVTHEQFSFWYNFQSLKQSKSPLVAVYSNFHFQITSPWYCQQAEA